MSFFNDYLFPVINVSWKLDQHWIGHIYYSSKFNASSLIILRLFVLHNHMAKSRKSEIVQNADKLIYKF